MRKKLLAANCTMHTTLPDGIELAKRVVTTIMPNEHVDLVICAPFTHLAILNEEVEGCALGAQNVHWAERGAFTGEISAEMLASIGVEYVIIGHSERRQYFSETNEQLRKKIDAAIKHRLVPIFCCGETLEQRSATSQQRVVQQQIEEGIFQFEPAMFASVVIAYEPVWAIGTGEVATPEQAQEMHAFIRSLTRSKYAEIADSVRIIYGGSVKASNADGLFAQPDIDGALVGGASLDADEFAAIHASLLNSIT